MTLLFILVLFILCFYLRAKATVLGNIPGTRVYECIDACDQVRY